MAAKTKLPSDKSNYKRKYQKTNFERPLNKRSEHQRDPYMRYFNSSTAMFSWASALINPPLTPFPFLKATSGKKNCKLKNLTHGSHLRGFEKGRLLLSSRNTALSAAIRPLLTSHKNNQQPCRHYCTVTGLASLNTLPSNRCPVSPCQNCTARLGRAPSLP